MARGAPNTATSTALTVLVIAAAAALVPGPVLAQETQVPLDRDGQIEEIDRALAERLGLFLDRYPDLQVVRLFELDPRSYVLEVSYRQGERLARQRVPLTVGEVRQLRDRVSEAVAQRAPRAALDQDGRFLLLGSTTLLGLGYYGWAIPVVLDLDDPQGAAAAYMFTAGASFVLPYLYTRDRPVTYGMANAGFWGATRGVSHGMYLAGTLDRDPSAAFLFGLGTAVSLAEGLAGYHWAMATDMSAGRAHTIGNYGDFGTASAGFALITLQPDDSPVVLGTLLAGGIGGIVAGSRLAPRHDFTWGDAEIQRAGFFLGAANAGVVWDWMLGDDPGDDDARLLGGMLLGGAAAGLLLTDRTLQGRDYSAGQGILVDLGTVAGGLVGLGAAFLTSPSDSDATPYLTLGAIGADIGFLATAASLADDARRQEADEDSRLELDLNPGALFLLQRAPGPGPATQLPVPLVSLRYRF